MKLYRCARHALMTGMMLAAAAATAQAADGSTTADDNQTPSLAAVKLFDGVQLTSCTECCNEPYCGCDDACGDVCGSTCGNSCGMGGGGGGGFSLGLGDPNCTTQLFVGAEYLLVRASFSQATSYLTTSVPPNATTAADTSFIYNQFDFDYDSSFRIYGGCRLCDCGQELRFTYSRFNSNGSFASPPQPGDGSLTFTAPFEVVTGGEGDRVFGTADVEINNFDIACSKCIPLGSPLCCDSPCGDCCDPCGGCWCPAWDLMFTGAVRFASVDSDQIYASDIVSTTTPGLVNRVAQNSVDFRGAGLRTGLLGRRYFGRKGIASVYMRGDLSLMLGEVENIASGTAFSTHRIETTQIVPVTELEVGGTVWMTPTCSITGGYMLAAWHDLGNRAEYDFGITGTQLESWDDANILGLDGFFLRAEAAF